MIGFDENILWLNISVKYAIFMHMVDSFKNLVHIILNFLRIKIGLPNFDNIIEIAIH